MATRLADVARDDDGNAVVGATVSVRRELDNVQIDSTTTGAGGEYQFSEDEIDYPGPIKTRVTDVNGNIRERSGTSTGQAGTIFISDLNRAFRMMTDGVIGGVDNELEVSADGGSMDVTIASGGAFLYGHPYFQASSKTVTPASNGTANPRIDLVVLRLVPPGEAEQGKITRAIVQGTPAASPVAPGATQDPNDVWEEALAEILVEPGVSVITAGKITDVRTYTSGPLMDNSVITAKILDGAVTAAKLATDAVTLAKMDTAGHVSTAAEAKVYKAPTVADDPPVIATLALAELSNVTEDAATAGQVLTWNATESKWKPQTPSALTLVIQEGDVTKVASANTLDFSADPFAVTETPTGEANIALTMGIGSTVPAVGNHVHTLTAPIADFDTKSYASTNVTSTSADGAEIAGFDIDIPSGGCVVLAQGGAQMNAPSSGAWIELGVKIGSQSTDWGMRTETEGGERPCIASSTRVYATGASGQRISLRARVDAGTGTVNAAHVNCIGIPQSVPASS